MQRSDQTDLSDLSGQFLQAFQLGDCPLNHLHSQQLPKQKVVVEILSDVLDLLFPYHRLENFSARQEDHFPFKGVVEKVQTKLSQQIYLAHVYSWQGSNPCPFTTDQADGLVLRFIARLINVRQKLCLDVAAAMAGDPAAKSFDEIVLCYPGFLATTVYRVAHELYLLEVPLLPRMMTEYAHSITGCDIHPGATIGQEFFIDHATGVVIGETTIIGDRVKIYQGVTLGGLKPHKGQSISGTKRHPTIENDVVIFAGATILGGQTVIGAGSKIGGSCWVTESIEPKTTVTLSDPNITVRKPVAAIS